MSSGDIKFEGGIMELAVMPPKPKDDLFVLKVGEKFDASVMRVNTDKEKLYSNIIKNVTSMIEQLRPYEESSQVICIVGGGWSLNEPVVYEELRELYFAGAKLVAINGAAKWLMDRNLRPSMHVILDARPQNVEFLKPKIPQCKLFLASQCDPLLFENVMDRDVTIFHALASDSCEVETKILDGYYGKGRWVHVPACSSAGVTAILLCRILGFRFQHLFGIDSCYKDEKVHHAYPQSLNDNERPAYFQVGKAGRTFLCSPWQCAQARSFLDMLTANHQHLELEIHGDALLAYLLQTAATENPSS